MLPTKRARPSIFVWSVGIHAIGLVVLAILSSVRHEAAPDEPVPVSVVFHAAPAPEPVRERIRERPMPPPPRPKPEPRPVRETPKEQVPVLRPEPPPPPRAEPRVATPAPPRPAPEVRTNVFADRAPSKPDRVPAPARPTTGGFGGAIDPTPPGPGLPVVAAKTGAFETAVGGGRPGAVVAPGRVSSGGFGDASTEPGARATAVREVAQGGFGDAKTEAPRAVPREVAAITPEEPVEILSKPKPVYTEEARARRIEGEVVLEVLFAATGELRVSRVVRGLGYGLDEAATVAARRIVFRPARHDGRPVDYAATLRVVFQLA
jgi:TonB family protein